MAAIYFIWLGSGRTRRYHVAPEGQLLDRAAKVGLPAAPGAILLDEFYRVCLEKDLAEMAGGRAVIPDAELLHATLFHSVRLPRFNRPVAVDLVAPGAANGASIELPPRRLIDANQPDELAQALVAAWNAAAQRDAAIGRCPRSSCCPARCASPRPACVSSRPNSGWPGNTVPATRSCRCGSACTGRWS